MKVFSDMHVGGEIIAQYNKKTYKQGYWYRINDNRIVFVPNTENGDLEKAYVHEDMFGVLFKNNEMNTLGIDFTVLHRTSLGTCATVIVQAVKHNKNSKLHGLADFRYKYNKAHKFEPNTEKLKEAELIYHEFYITKFIPNGSTAPFNMTTYSEGIRSNSANLSLDNIYTALDLPENGNGHGHVCVYCKKPYVHVHPHKDDKFTHLAKHPQFNYDCPYSDCANYNHIDCINCLTPEHVLAIKTLVKFTKKTYRLNEKAIEEYNKDIKNFNDNGLTVKVHGKTNKTLVANNNIMTADVANSITAVGDNVQVDDGVLKPKLVEKKLELVLQDNNMTTDGLQIAVTNHTGDIIKGQIHRFTNPNTKMNEFYCMLEGGNYHTVMALSDSNTGGIVFTIEPIGLCVNTNDLGLMLKRAYKSASNDAIFQMIHTHLTTKYAHNYDHNVLAHIANYIQLQTLLAYTIRNNACTSTTALLIDEARNGGVNIDYGALKNLKRYGLFKTMGMLLTKLQCCGLFSTNINNVKDINAFGIGDRFTSTNKFKKSFAFGGPQISKL